MGIAGAEGLWVSQRGATHRQTRPCFLVMGPRLPLGASATQTFLCPEQPPGVLCDDSQSNLGWMNRHEVREEQAAGQRPRPDRSRRAARHAGPSVRVPCRWHAMLPARTRELAWGKAPGSKWPGGDKYWCHPPWVTTDTQPLSSPAVA